MIKIKLIKNRNLPQLEKNIINNARVEKWGKKEKKDLFIKIRRQGNKLEIMKMIEDIMGAKMVSSKKLYQLNNLFTLM